MLVIGSIGAIGGSLVAIAQVDIKRTFLIPRQRISAGIAITLQIPVLALLLLTHAVSKALLDEHRRRDRIHQLPGHH